MNFPKISIIIPIYNVEQYLDRCISSVINQSLKDIEIILVDDESPDKCPQMCDDWGSRDNRVKVVHKKNCGLGFARNSGLDVATGEYVTFLDSDDVVNLSTYQTCYKHAKDDNLDICYFNYRRFSYDSEIDINNTDSGEYELIAGIKDCEDYMLNMIGKVPGDNSKKSYSMSSCMAIFRRSIIEVNNIRFVSEKNIASEDLLFHLDYLPHATRIGKMSNTFYYYYFNPGSITNSYNDGKRDRMIYLLEVVKQHLEGRYPKELYLPHYYSQIMRIYKIILKFESKSVSPLNKKKERIYSLLDKPFLKEMYLDPITKKYDIVNKFIVFCMKKRFVLPLIILYKYFK